MTDGRVLQGIGVSPGVAIGQALVVDWRFPDVPDRSIGSEEVDAEVDRFARCRQRVAEHLDRLRRQVLDRAGPEEAGIFEAQAMMVDDPEFIASVEHLIRVNLLSAETAYEFKALEIRVAWTGSGNSRLRERLADLTAVQIRMLRVITGGDPEEFTINAPDGHVVVVAHELSPGLTVQFDRERLAGLVAEEGTRTSHAAILAHSLGIPAVMGVAGALDRIQPGVPILLDGQSGTLLLDPTPAELREVSVQVARRRKLQLELEAVAGEPCALLDGSPMRLQANVDLPEELDQAARNGAEGVGLLRTEFLITGRARLPSEDEQTAYYRRVATAFPSHPVTIRTYDLGGDKFPAAFEAMQEANPFLGWRSIRVCLDHPHIFRPQLRAVLRAAVGGNVQALLPLVTRVEEVEEVRALLAEEADALARAGVEAAATVPVGVMIETPAAVVIADRLAEVSDFFSVGTNDLTQYTLAVDRGNARLASRFLPHDPAMVRQLVTVARVAEAAGIPCGVCGEMASDPLMAVLLVGLGYRSLSVAPPTLLLVKWLLRQVPREACEDAARDALSAGSAEQVAQALRDRVAAFVDTRVLDPHGPLPGRGRRA